MKLHEDAGTLVLQFNALTGSVSTFVIDKEKGKLGPPPPAIPDP